jgi:pectate lyase
MRSSRAWIYLLLVVFANCQSPSEPPASADAASAVLDDAAVDGTPPGDADVVHDASPPSTPDAAVPLEAPVGWASVASNGLTGTTGGAAGQTVTVSTFNDLKNRAASASPLTIHITGTITGTINVASDKTLIGMPGAVLRGSISLAGVQNVVIQNLKIVGYNCADAACGDGSDAVHVQTSHHVWLDHLDISDGTDGNLDITHQSNYVTVSWSKFWYSSAGRDHALSNLVGADDNDTTDTGKLKVTFHHNWWAKNISSRMPRARFGQIHLFNNLFASTNNSYCILSALEASLLVEKNVFSGVDNPHYTQQGGNLRAVGNVYQNTTGDKTSTGSAFTPPYEYTADATTGLAAAIMAGAGPN